MKNPFKKIILVFSLLFSLNIFAQKENVAAGGEATGSGGTASYSYGQVVYTSNSGSEGNTAQGVQQAYEISVMTDLTKGLEIFSELNVYPNPTPDLLTLVVRQSAQKELKYELSDVLGRILSNDKIVAEKTSVSLMPYKQGSYFLKVINEDKEVKTFKIIKN